MTHEEHKQKHIELHKKLDEILADFITNSEFTSPYIMRPIIDLLNWSYRQTIELTHKEAE